VAHRWFQEKNHCENCFRHLTSEKYTHTCLKLPLLVDLQQKGDLVLSITSCPTIIVLENAVN
jgi:hypothetical protein